MSAETDPQPTDGDVRAYVWATSVLAWHVVRPRPGRALDQATRSAA